MERNVFLKTKNETKSLEPMEQNFLNEQNFLFLPAIFAELVHQIKKNLSSIKTLTQFSREKFRDVEFGNYFYKSVTEDIEKINSVMEGLLNYIRINTPIKKTNTVHSILQEVLRKHMVPLQDKNIKIAKKFEKDLPETIVHDEQLKYILNSILDYALPLIPVNGNIGFLTKSFDIQKGAGASKTLPEEEGRYIEILIVFTGYEKTIEKLQAISGIPSEKEEPIDLILQLIKDLVEKNRGIIKFEVNEKKPETLISLKFPVERRKVVYYRSTNA